MLDWVGECAQREPPLRPQIQSNPTPLGSSSEAGTPLALRFRRAHRVQHTAFGGPSASRRAHLGRFFRALPSRRPRAHRRGKAVWVRGPLLEHICPQRTSRLATFFGDRTRWPPIRLQPASWPKRRRVCRRCACVGRGSTSSAPRWAKAVGNCGRRHVWPTDLVLFRRRRVGCGP